MKKYKYYIVENADKYIVLRITPQKHDWVLKEIYAGSMIEAWNIKQEFIANMGPRAGGIDENY